MVALRRCAAGLLVLTFVLAAAVTSCGGPPGTTSICTVTLVVTSSGFADGGAIPVRYTAAGANISPPVSWNQLPPAISSLALLMEDLDAPGGAFTHWLVYNIPATETGFGDGVPVADALPNGARQAKNSLGVAGYSGPNPPAGAVHHYRLTVYALDIKLLGGAGMTRSRFLSEIQGHVQAQGQITGVYSK
jgi:Raf kinase inhibitor-like YbhB/YbcL family protein